MYSIYHTMADAITKVIIAIAKATTDAAVDIKGLAKSIKADDWTIQ